MERLVELCGRVCYDSLGKGRGSAAYHAHIAEVGHGSVWEHANVTLRVPRYGENMLDTALLFLNRPGVWVRFGDDGALRVTMNLRSIMEFGTVAVSPWDRPLTKPSGQETAAMQALRLALLAAVMPYAPQIIACPLGPNSTDVTVVGPEHPEEKWVSLLLGGSRGMSHEQVRHKFRTAVSQRSTRYVDESDSPWVKHPLVTIDDEHTTGSQEAHIGEYVCEHSGQHHELEGVAQEVYRATVERLNIRLLSRGIDKHTARKQSRGAARGFLGNALHTELIFSASVAQWRRMLAQRSSSHADAEIRVLYGKALQALKTTRWADDFADLKLVPSPDGIGEVIG
jgi:thymidylate synthase ThyX